MKRSATRPDARPDHRHSRFHGPVCDRCDLPVRWHGPGCECSPKHKRTPSCTGAH